MRMEMLQILTRKAVILDPIDSGTGERYGDMRTAIMRSSLKRALQQDVDTIL